MNEKPPDSVRCSASGERDPLVGPFLQNAGQRTMTIAWIRANDAPCVLTYGIEGKRAEEVRVRPLRRIEGSPDFFYAAKLERLMPGARYVYTLRCPGGRHESSFRTFPPHAEPFTFIYYGDNKAGIEVHRRIVALFPRHLPAFIMHSGDMTEHGRYEEYRPCFFEPLESMIDHVPLFTARGNHEGDGRAYRQVFALPFGETWYSFDYGHVHFIVLDTNGWRHEAEKADIQRMYEWCEKDLAASRAVWKIAMYHEPSYDLGWRKDDWGRNDFLPLMRRHGVDLTLTGHAHGYQRLRPMVSRGENEQHPITHVTSAGAGASVGNKPLDASDFLAVEARRHNYVVFAVDGEKIEARVFSDRDELLDRFELVKHRGRYDESILREALWEEDYGKPGKLKGPFSP